MPTFLSLTQLYTANFLSLESPSNLYQQPKKQHQAWRSVKVDESRSCWVSCQLKHCRGLWFGIVRVFLVLSLLFTGKYIATKSKQNTVLLEKDWCSQTCHWGGQRPCSHTAWPGRRALGHKDPLCIWMNLLVRQQVTSSPFPYLLTQVSASELLCVAVGV